MEAIPYTEFEVQAVAYMLLKRAGYDAHGEYVWKGPKVQHTTRTGKARTMGARFDLVILGTKQELLLILEVKKKEQAVIGKLGQYSRLAGVPAIGIRGM